MPASSTVASLRSLLAARFPERVRRSGNFVPTGIGPIDDALGGGLPASQLTELVSAQPGTGGQTVIAALLRSTRNLRQRVALVDGANGFVADEIPADQLRHLVWVRAHGATEAFATADILVRDGNYALVVLDLRGLAERTLLKTSPTIWHRLRHATETGCSAVLVQTTTPLVPTVPSRLVLCEPQTLAKRRTARQKLAEGLIVRIERCRVETMEESA